MIPVCVITYNHPKDEFIEKIMKINHYQNDKVKHPVYYFIYDKDWNTYNYNNYKDKFKELYFVKVSYEQYSKAQRMRKFVQEYMTNLNQDYFWLLDNDIMLSGFRGYSFQEKKTKSLTLDEALSQMENIFYNYSSEYLIVSPKITFGGLSESVPEEPIKFTNVLQCILLNNQLLNKNNIHYTGDVNVFEDMEINLNCLLKGFKTGSFTAFSYTTNNPVGSDGWYKLEELTINTWNKYKHTGYLMKRYDREGKLRLRLLAESTGSEMEIELWE